MEKSNNLSLTEQLQNSLNEVALQLSFTNMPCETGHIVLTEIVRCLNLVEKMNELQNK